MLLIKNARTHNLKNLTVRLPEEKIIVVTGVSGSGKSSFVFDTIYVESQRRFLEVLNSYTQYMIGESFSEPEVDDIEGISPSVGLKQVKSNVFSSRSTVGTLSEVYDFLRILYTYCSFPQCPDCGVELRSFSEEEIWQFIYQNFLWKKLKILVPVVTFRKGEYRNLLEQGLKAGFMRVVIDGEEKLLTEALKGKLSKTHTHNIDFVVDRINFTPAKEKRLKNALVMAHRFNSKLLKVEVEGKVHYFNREFVCPECQKGFIDIVPRLFSFNSSYGMCLACEGSGEVSGKVCSECGGERLNRWARSVKIGGKNIFQISSLSIDGLQEFLKKVSRWRNEAVAKKILPDLREKLKILSNLGIGYLELIRPADCISGGELQRLLLSRLIVNNLSGILYIFDEPSIGLHPRDCKKLTDFFKELKKRGNTLILVEHEEELIKIGDYFLDFGEYAGSRGGKIDFSGDKKEFFKSSYTGKYLKKLEKTKPTWTKKEGKDIKNSGFWVRGATRNNLKGFDVYFPLQAISVITGVSGAGKSSLLDVIESAYNSEKLEVRGSSWQEVKFLKRVDQNLQKKSSRSIPATFLGIFNKIRDIYANLEVSKIRGLRSEDFSFNSSRSRGVCEVCRGKGLEKFKMQYLADYEFTCRACRGLRYNPYVLASTYQGKNIGELLQLTIEEAHSFFKEYPSLQRNLKRAMDFGLGYLQLGQPLSTLSGGEIQRMKLLSQLTSTTKGIYLLEEPTIGLHFRDVDILVSLLRELQKQGNTLIIVDNTRQLLWQADWIVELGPEGGDKGGKLLFQGEKGDFFKDNSSV